MESNLKLIIMPNCQAFGNLVHENLKLIRKTNEDFIVTTKLERFNNSEGKAHKTGNVTGKDVYLLTDVGNYDETYKMYGFDNHKSFDDHFQDTKRVLSSMRSQAARVNLVMPLLYSSRQHKRKGNESLDCSLALRELEEVGADRIITFDVHDATVQTALKHSTFENVYPTYSILKNLIKNEDIDLDNMMIISPDAGAVDRAAYYADCLGTDIGIFSKRRDYSKLEDGKHPIVDHNYHGKDFTGKYLLIVDDMIASGDSMIEVARYLRENGANKIFLITSFALFSTGLKSVNMFSSAYKDGVFNKLYTTNLSYIPESIKSQDWIEAVDCSKYLAKIIDRSNKNEPIDDLINGSSKQKILKLADKKRNGLI